VLLVGALIAGFIAVHQADRADNQAAAAQRVAVAADARRVGTRARLSDEISLSVLLAIAGVRLDDAAETRANLHAVLDRNSRLVRSVPAANGETAGIIASPDGRWIAASDNSNRLHLYDARDGRLLRSYTDGSKPTSEDAGVAAAFSPDGTLLAAGPYIVSNQPVHLLDPRTTRETTIRLAPMPALPGSTASGYGVSPSSSVPMVATSGRSWWRSIPRTRG
jgi:hypothetical protein